MMREETCQRCGVANGAYGARDRFGGWHDDDDIHGMNSDTGMHYFGELFDWRMIRIRLGVSSVTGELLCQRCQARARPKQPATKRPSWPGEQGRLPL